MLFDVSSSWLRHMRPVPAKSLADDMPHANRGAPLWLIDGCEPKAAVTARAELSPTRGFGPPSAESSSESDESAATPGKPAGGQRKRRWAEAEQAGQPNKELLREAGGRLAPLSAPSSEASHLLGGPDTGFSAAARHPAAPGWPPSSAAHATATSPIGPANGPCIYRPRPGRLAPGGVWVDCAAGTSRAAGSVGDTPAVAEGWRAAPGSPDAPAEHVDALILALHCGGGLDAGSGTLSPPVGGGGGAGRGLCDCADGGGSAEWSLASGP